MSELKDPRFIATIVVMILGWVGSYFTTTATLNVKLDSVIEQAKTHVSKEPYEIRMSYHEHNIDKNEKKINGIIDSFLKKYPDWRDYELERLKKERDEEKSRQGKRYGTKD